MNRRNSGSKAAHRNSDIGSTSFHVVKFAECDSADCASVYSQQAARNGVFVDSMKADSAIIHDETDKSSSIYSSSRNLRLETFMEGLSVLSRMHRSWTSMSSFVSHVEVHQSHQLQAVCCSITLFLVFKPSSNSCKILH